MTYDPSHRMPPRQERWPAATPPEGWPSYQTGAQQAMATAAYPAVRSGYGGYAGAADDFDGRDFYRQDGYGQDSYGQDGYRPDGYAAGRLRARRLPAQDGYRAGRLPARTATGRTATPEAASATPSLRMATNGAPRTATGMALTWGPAATSSLGMR